jgi:type IV secretion system protein TrbL
MAIVLAALSLLALGIFGPGIANGIVSGGPQLGAGAAVGTGLAAGGMVVGGLAGGKMAASAVGAGARGAASIAGGASTAYKVGHTAAGGGAAGVAGGMASVGKAGMSAAASPLRRMGQSMKDSYHAGSRAAFGATGGSVTGGTASSSPVNDGPPAWAQKLKRQQSLHHGVATTAHVIRSGDHGGGGTSVSLSEKP